MRPFPDFMFEFDPMHSYFDILDIEFIFAEPIFGLALIVSGCDPGVSGELIVRWEFAGVSHIHFAAGSSQLVYSTMECPVCERSGDGFELRMFLNSGKPIKVDAPGPAFSIRFESMTAKVISPALISFANSEMREDSVLLRPHFEETARRFYIAKRCGRGSPPW